jgi:hypothetical protein
MTENPTVGVGARSLQPNADLVSARWSWSTFGYGAVGALAPEIIRLHNIVTGVSSGTIKVFDPLYLLVSLVFVVLGGIVAVAWGERTAFKSFGVGVALPVIISSLGSNFPTGAHQSHMEPLGPKSTPPTESSRLTGDQLLKDASTSSSEAKNLAETSVAEVDGVRSMYWDMLRARGIGRDAASEGAGGGWGRRRR